MKHLISLLFIVLIMSCDNVENDIDPDLNEAKFTGEWKAEEGGSGGINFPDSYKNYQLDLKVEGNNQKIVINITSPDIDIWYGLYDPLGQQLAFSGNSRSHIADFTLNAGSYRLAVCAQRRAVGKFEVFVDGIKTKLERRSSQRLNSEAQKWVAPGSAGPARSFRNGFYTFEVTENNTPVDIEMESGDTETALHFYNELGVLTAQADGERYVYLVRSLNKGVYTVMAGTRERGQVGNYKLSVTGKVQNIKKTESASTTKTGRWNDSMARDTYMVEVLTANSPLDIQLSSPDTDVRLELQTENGDYIETKYLDRSEFIVRNMAKGKYRIVTGPAVRSASAGNYTLDIVGQVGSVTKL